MAYNVPRRLPLVGLLGAVLALGAALTPVAPHFAHAQFGSAAGPLAPAGGGPGFGTVSGEFVVPGQTQICREYPGAEANWQAYYGPGYASSGGFALPFVFPVYANYNLPPFGGFWGMYTGVGPICLWRP